MLSLVHILPFSNVVTIAELHRHVFFVVIRTFSSVARDARYVVIGEVVRLVRLDFTHPLLGHLAFAQTSVALASRFAKVCIVRVVIRVKVLLVAGELLLRGSCKRRSMM